MRAPDKSDILAITIRRLATATRLAECDLVGGDADEAARTLLDALADATERLAAVRSLLPPQ